jgi:hypothetical protein
MDFEIVEIVLLRPTEESLDEGILCLLDKQCM